jgi:hypothetical protein
VWGEQAVLLEFEDRKQKLTGKLKDIQPGDVIQFRDTESAGTRVNGKGTYSMCFSHHTAVVSEVANGGQLVSILH